MSDGWVIYFDLMRVGHIFAGILWIGILYFFNFIMVPNMPKMEASARPHFQVSLQSATLTWFRWAALATLVFGLAYVIGAGIENDSYWSSSRFHSILIGGGLGVIMWFNVWFIIWPNLQKVFTAVRATIADGTPAPAEQPKWARKALLASRTNTMLSIPMLYAMASAQNLF